MYRAIREAYAVGFALVAVAIVTVSGCGADGGGGGAAAGELTASKNMEQLGSIIKRLIG